MKDSVLIAGKRCKGQLSFCFRKLQEILCVIPKSTKETFHDMINTELLSQQKWRDIVKRAAVTIQTLTKINLRIPPGREAVNMCKAAEEWKEELLTQGRAEGRAEGYDEKTLIVYRNCLNRGMSKQDAIAISGITSELLKTVSE